MREAEAGFLDICKIEQLGSFTVYKSINKHRVFFLPFLQLATCPQKSLGEKKLVFITYNGAFYVFVLFFKVFHQIGMVISYTFEGNQNPESLTRLNNLIQIK